MQGKALPLQSLCREPPGSLFLMKNPFKFLLYIVSADHAEAAEEIQSLRRFLTEELTKQFELEVVDVLQHPHLAIKEGILATPTLVRVSPPPPLRIVGDYTNREKVLAALELID